jgi:uncharacterized membrane protein
MKPDQYDPAAHRMWHISGVKRWFSRHAIAVTVIATVGLAVASGCSGSNPISCPNDLPVSCPNPAPTFAADVAPLIQQHCAVCHRVGGVNPNPLLETYAQISADAGIAVESQIYACKMPPAPEIALTAEQRAAIFGWIMCGAMNN